MKRFDEGKFEAMKRRQREERELGKSLSHMRQVRKIGWNRSVEEFVKKYLLPKSQSELFKHIL